MLTTLDTLPAGFFEASPTTLHEILPGPTLITLEGKRPQPLFISVLLHGNETVGFEAIQKVLAKTVHGAGAQPLARSLSLFIGNTQAAARGLRHLPGQPDFNRIWPGGAQPRTPEHKITAEVFAAMKQRQPFASVDIHNTSGMNPHYACVNRLDAAPLHLASFFSRTVVYFRLPKGAQSLAFSEICPSVTVECGKTGDKTGVDHAEEFLSACLHLSELPHHDVARHDITLFHTVGRVTVDKATTFGFGSEKVDLRFVDHLDQFNFTELPTGTILGRVKGNGKPPIAVRNENGHDVTDDYFLVEEGLLKTRTGVMPSMLTKDMTIIREDCLCYVMERYPFGIEGR
ncbi:MAG: M14 family metallopeptidase [Sphingomonadales bacterium]